MMSNIPIKSREEAFYDKVQDLTAELVQNLYYKWSSMYEMTDEFKQNRLLTLTNHIQEFYDDIIQHEEKKRDKLINDMDQRLKEFDQLQKDLGMIVEDVRRMNVEEPYVVFIKRIEDNMQLLEEVRQKRTTRYQSLVRQEEELCDALSLPPLPKVPNEIIPSEKQIEDIESQIFLLSEEMSQRLTLFAESKDRIIQIINELEYEPKCRFETELLEGSKDNFKPTTENMNRLRATKNDLEQELEHAKLHAQHLSERLQKLWERINTEPADRERFLTLHKGVGKSTLSAMEVEVQRCEEIKLANIRPVIESIRGEMAALYDRLTFTGDQRQAFRPFFTDHFSEDVLELHEIEYDRLQLYYEKYKNIFELAEKRNILWERMLDLDEIAKDKNRLFNNRGGQLLREERERKTLEASLPKIDKQLKRALEEHLEKEGRLFLWHGTDLLDKITNDWEERQALRESRKLARKVENQKTVENEAKLGTQLAQKRKFGGLHNVSQPKMRRGNDFADQTVTLSKGGFKTPSRNHLRSRPTTPRTADISAASVASYSHFQDQIERSECRSGALRENCPPGTPGIAHSSPTTTSTPARRATPRTRTPGPRGLPTTPRSCIRGPVATPRGATPGRTPRTPLTVPRMTRLKDRFPIDI